MAITVIISATDEMLVPVMSVVMVMMMVAMMTSACLRKRWGGQSDS
ncbi:hypothetical protein R2103_04665 [Nitrosomonas sp. Is24]|nr:hypothetical protein [Nitrosomonas sp. Is24]MDV6341060.1 hypothetical protein [Nitrosomonas sp. Is24]